MSLSPKQVKDIQEKEAAGIKVVLINDEGKIIYDTDANCCSRYCDTCECFRAYKGAPNDFYEDDPVVLVCSKLGTRIVEHEVRPFEANNVVAPENCPRKYTE